MPDNEMSAEEVSKWILHRLETDEVQSQFGGKRIPKPLTADWWKTLNELLQVALVTAQERGRREGLEEAAKIANDEANGDYLDAGTEYLAALHVEQCIRSRLAQKGSE